MHPTEQDARQILAVSFRLKVVLHSPEWQGAVRCFCDKFLKGDTKSETVADMIEASDAIDDDADEGESEDVENLEADDCQPYMTSNSLRFENEDDANGEPQLMVKSLLTGGSALSDSTVSFGDRLDFACVVLAHARELVAAVVCHF